MPKRKIKYFKVTGPRGGKRVVAIKARYLKTKKAKNQLISGRKRGYKIMPIGLVRARRLAALSKKRKGKSIRVGRTSRVLMIPKK